MVFLVNASLRDGDIISVDVGAIVGGYCGDSAWTYAVGSISRRRAAVAACNGRVTLRGNRRCSGR